MANFGPDDSQNPINPFAAPASASSVLGVAGDGSEFESIRRKHLNHEASIKSFGFLYYIGGALVLIGGLSVLTTTIFSLTANERHNGVTLMLMVLGGVYLLLGSFQIYTARSLRRLSAVGRGCATFFGVLGLLAFPIGTLISAYLLYLLWSQKGQVVFSPIYQDVLKATPHIVYKTSIIVWILLALLVTLILFGVVGVMLE